MNASNGLLEFAAGSAASVPPGTASFRSKKIAETVQADGLLFAPGQRLQRIEAKELKKHNVRVILGRYLLAAGEVAPGQGVVAIVGNGNQTPNKATHDPCFSGR